MTLTELSDEIDLGECLTPSSPKVIMTIDYNTDVYNAWHILNVNERFLPLKNAKKQGGLLVPSLQVLTCWRVPLEYLLENKVKSDGTLVHAPPNGPPQQFNVFFQVAPEELWEVPGKDVYLDKLHQPLHSILGNNTLNCKDAVYLHFNPIAYPIPHCCSWPRGEQNA